MVEVATGSLVLYFVNFAAGFTFEAFSFFGQHQIEISEYFVVVNKFSTDVIALFVKKSWYCGFLLQLFCVFLMPMMLLGARCSMFSSCPCVRASGKFVNTARGTSPNLQF